MICAINPYDYLKPLLLGIFFGAFIVLKLKKRPVIREIERITKLLGQ